MKRNIILFLEDILESIRKIESSTKNLSKKDFEKNPDIQDATVRRIEIIWEAVKNLPKNFKEKYPKIDWRKIAGTRDVLIHGYFGVSLNRIWDVIRSEIPKLKKDIQNILEKEKDNKQHL